MAEKSVRAFKEPPLFDLKLKTFEVYLNELELWKEMSPIEKKQQGPAVALSLPEGSSIRTKKNSEVDLKTLKTEDGLQKSS